MGMSCTLCQGSCSCFLDKKGKLCILKSEFSCRLCREISFNLYGTFLPLLPLLLLPVHPVPISAASSSQKPSEFFIPMKSSHTVPSSTLSGFFWQLGGKWKGKSFMVFATQGLHQGSLICGDGRCTIQPACPSSVQMQYSSNSADKLSWLGNGIVERLQTCQNLSEVSWRWQENQFQLKVVWPTRPQPNFKTLPQSTWMLKLLTAWL